MVVLNANKCLQVELAFTNCAYVHPDELPREVEWVIVTPDQCSRSSVFKLSRDTRVSKGDITFNQPGRKWAEIPILKPIEVKPFNFLSNESNSHLSLMEIEVDFHKPPTPEQLKDKMFCMCDTGEMIKDFTSQFTNFPFSVGQLFVFQFNEKKNFFGTVAKLEALNIGKMKHEQDVQPTEVSVGRFLPSTNIVFKSSPKSQLRLVGKHAGQGPRMAVINPDFDFGKIGIGGLDSEFNSIFRRAFASRLFPPNIIEELGCKHVKGILLYGPPGTGKTLLARQIGKMLNTREPKIVNGPQILDKYVGESEANIRKLFADAEEEERQYGMHSALHIIIFDEMDAICKARGTVGGNTGVHDTVVNQLLSKIDGVDQLNNILIIGMTNRKDMIDEALLRPGRLEVQVEIGLPNEHGRIQILDIHTSKIRSYNKLAGDVDIRELASLTKNFSGAELEGLVRAAQSVAMNRLISAKSKVEVDPEAVKKLMVVREDFLHALENDIKPAFGSSKETLDCFLRRDIVIWGLPVSSILEDGALLCQQVRSTETSGLVSVLLEGPPNAGKSALAASLAKNSDFPFVKVCSPEDMVGFNESAKCNSIRKVFDDAYRSTLSCVLVDNIERLLDYGPMGPRYSNLTLQALLVLLKKEPPFGRKLLIVCTTSQRQVLEDMQMLSCFTSVLHVPNLNKPEHLLAVLEKSHIFNRNQLKSIEKKIHGQRVFVGIKKLLALIDLVQQTEEECRVRKFLTKMEEEGCLGETGIH